MIVIFLVSFESVFAHQLTGGPYQKAKVTDITAQTTGPAPDSEILTQQLEILLPDGSTTSNVYNGYVPVKPGQTVYVGEGLSLPDDPVGYYVQEVDRMASALAVFVLFLFFYVLMTGLKGLRSLLGLAMAIVIVAFVLIPALIAGYDPLPISLLISSAVLACAIFVTHGFSVIALASFAGSMLAIGCTVVFGHVAVWLTDLSSSVGHEANALAAAYAGGIDLQGLFLAAMIIGILGVLDDVAVMQAAMVREFMHEKKYTAREVFTKAMIVGREHAAALVNTLVLAYVAVSLPLLMSVFAPGGVGIPFTMRLSSELFVAEFVRSITGSFGLVMTIPLVTLIALFLYRRYPNALEQERHTASAHAGHHH